MPSLDDIKMNKLQTKYKSLCDHLRYLQQFFYQFFFYLMPLLNKIVQNTCRNVWQCKVSEEDTTFCMRSVTSPKFVHQRNCSLLFKISARDALCITLAPSQNKQSQILKTVWKKGILFFIKQI